MSCFVKCFLAFLAFHQENIEMFSYICFMILTFIADYVYLLVELQIGFGICFLKITYLNVIIPVMRFAFAP